MPTYTNLLSFFFSLEVSKTRHSVLVALAVVLLSQKQLAMGSLWHG